MRKHIRASCLRPSCTVKTERHFYSWRVLLLPYVEGQNLHARFKLDEPWDSPDNIKLVEEMPSTYAAPHYHDGYIPPYHTICHVFVGPGTPFESREGLRLEKDFPDGICNTFLVIEAGNPVPWSKPEDIEFNPNSPISLRGPFRHYFRAAMGDGAVRQVPYTMSQSSLRALITRNGNDGQDIPHDWFLGP
jgi:uncharacterized protein DUF1559